MAGEIAAFDADAYWNSGECWQAEYYDAKEAFMEDWLLETEEDFRACLLEEWLDDQWWDCWYAQEVRRLDTITMAAIIPIGIRTNVAPRRIASTAAVRHKGMLLSPCMFPAFLTNIRNTSISMIIARPRYLRTPTRSFALRARGFVSSSSCDGRIGWRFTFRMA